MKIDERDAARRTEAKTAIENINKEIKRLLDEQQPKLDGDTVDAAGVSEYLADEEAVSGDVKEGNDLLRPVIKLGKRKTIFSKPENAIVSGKNETGDSTDDEVHKEDKPINPGPRVLRIRVKPSDTGENNGDAQGTGNRNVIIPRLHYKSIVINAKQGLYKIIIIPEEEHNNVYLSCRAVGEDSSYESIEIKSFMKDKKSIAISGEKVGPVNLSKETSNEFFACFANHEKMKIDINLTKGEQ